MNELVKLFRDIERVFLRFAELTCNCGASHRAEPEDHAEHCPYCRAFEKEKRP